MIDYLPPEKFTKTHVSYSEVNRFRQCPRAWYLEYVQGWRRREVARPLTLGSAWHTVLEHHHGGTRDPWDVILEDFSPAKKIEKGILAGHSDGAEDLRPVLIWMLDGYTQKWGDPEDKDSDLGKTIAVEEEWLVPLPNPTTERTHLKMIVDHIGGHPTRGLVISDHKSGAQRLDDRTMEIEPQFAFYSWGARQVLDEKATWACRSWSKTKQLKTKEDPLENRFERHPQFLHEAAVTNAIDALMRDLEAMAEYPKQRHFERMHCGWCSVREACVAGNARPEIELDMLHESHEIPQSHIDRFYPELTEEDDLPWHR